MSNARKLPSPAASARAELARKYDDQAKELQDMHDMARDLSPEIGREHLANAADRAKTMAARARRKVGPMGESLGPTPNPPAHNHADSVSAPFPRRPAPKPTSRPATRAELHS